MLKSIVFLPCEKIIISDAGLITLANVLDRINVNASQDGDDVPEHDAATLMPWEIATIWRRMDDEDAGKSFDQKVVLTRPDGTEAFALGQTFNVQDHRNVRILGKLVAFPVGVTGIAWLTLSIRESGDENEWKEVAQFPIEITHSPHEEAVVDAQQVISRRNPVVFPVE